VHTVQVVEGLPFYLILIGLHMVVVHTVVAHHIVFVEVHMVVVLFQGDTGEWVNIVCIVAPVAHIG